MNGSPTIFSALLLGLIASGHCVLMCGGINTALGMATAKNSRGQSRVELLAAYQLGRIFSYAIAGLLFSFTLSGVLHVLDSDAVRGTLRAMSALMLVLAAMVLFGRLREPGGAIGQRIWPFIAGLGRRLLPVSNIYRAIAFGMLWGWMPCGFVYTVLFMATLQADATQGALTMLAFGVGTAPALLLLSVGARLQIARWTGPITRQIAGTVLLCSAVLTIMAPALIRLLPQLDGWLPFDCMPVGG